MSRLLKLKDYFFETERRESSGGRMVITPDKCPLSKENCGCCSWFGGLVLQKRLSNGKHIAYKFPSQVRCPLPNSIIFIKDI